MITESKSSLRKEMLAKRNAISDEEAEKKSAEITKRILEIKQVKGAKTIAVYIAKGSEVRTKRLVNELIKNNIEVLVPVTIGEEEIELYRFNSFEDLTPGKFGIPEPKTKTRGASEPEVVIVPGVAFDLDLHRLGYGKGYYDRLFQKLKTFKIGICYELQVIEKIPRHEHDQKLNMTVTEQRVIML